MYVLGLITELPLPVPEGDYTALKVLMGIVVVIVTTLAWIFAEWQKNHPEPEKTITAPLAVSPPLTEFYYEGPLSTALKSLKDLVGAVEHMAVTVGDIRSLKNELADRMKETRISAMGETAKVVAAAELLEQRVRQLEQELAELKGRLHDYRRPR